MKTIAFLTAEIYDISDYVMIITIYVWKYVNQFFKRFH